MISNIDVRFTNLGYLMSFSRHIYIILDKNSIFYFMYLYYLLKNGVVLQENKKYIFI